MCDRFFPDEPEYDIEILEWIVDRTKSFPNSPVK